MGAWDYRKASDSPRSGALPRAVSSVSQEQSRKVYVWKGKFLDPKKDCYARYKYLRQLNSVLSGVELSNFFETNANQAFSVLSDQFTLFSILFRKGTQKYVVDEYCNMIPILYNIIIHNQRLIAGRWNQFALYNILKQLLYEKNSEEVRYGTISVYIAWCIGLGDSINKEVQDLVYLIIPGIKDYSYNDITSVDGVHCNAESNTVTCSIKFNPSAAIKESFLLLRYGLFSSSTARTGYLYQKAIGLAGKLVSESSTVFFLNSYIKEMSRTLYEISLLEDEVTMKLEAFLPLVRRFIRMIVTEFIPLDIFDLKLVGEQNFKYLSFLQLKEFDPTSKPPHDLTEEQKCSLQVIKWISRTLYSYLRYYNSKIDSDVFNFSIGDVLVKDVPQIVKNIESLDNSIKASDNSQPSFTVRLIVSALFTDIEFMNFCLHVFLKGLSDFFNEDAIAHTILASLSHMVESNVLESLLKGKPYLYSDPKYSMRAMFNIMFSVAANLFNPANAVTNKDIYIIYSIVYFRIMRSFINNREESIDEEQWNTFYDILNHLVENVFTLEFCEYLGTGSTRLLNYLYQTYFLCFIRGGSTRNLDEDRWEAFKRNVLKKKDDNNLLRTWSESCEIVTSVLCQYLYDIDTKYLPLEQDISAKRQKILKKAGKGNNDKISHSRQVSYSFLFSFGKGKISSTGQPPHCPHQPTSLVTASVPMKPTDEVKESDSSTDNQLISPPLFFQEKEVIMDVCIDEKADENIVSLDKSSGTRASETESYSTKNPSLPCSVEKVPETSATAGLQLSYVCILWKKYMSLMGELYESDKEECKLGLLENYYNVWKILYKCHCNQAVSLDNKFSPPMPEYVPPLFFFSNIVFDIMEDFSNESETLVATAIRFMVDMYKFDHVYTPPSENFLVKFYENVFKIVESKNRNLISVLLDSCSQIFYYEHPGISVLVPILSWGFYLMFSEAETPSLGELKAKLLVSLIQYTMVFSELPISKDLFYKIDERVFDAYSIREGKMLQLGDCFGNLQSILYSVALHEESLGGRVAALSALIKVITHYASVEDDCAKALQRSIAVLLQHLNHRNPVLLLTAVSCVKALNYFLPMIENIISGIRFIIISYLCKAIHDFSRITADKKFDIYYCVSQLMHLLLDLCAPINGTMFKNVNDYNNFISEVMKPLDVYTKKEKVNEEPENYQVLAFLKYGEFLACSREPEMSGSILPSTTSVCQSEMDIADEKEKKKQFLLSTVNHVKYFLNSFMGQFPSASPSAMVSALISEKREFQSGFPYLVFALEEELIMTVTEFSDDNKSQEKYDKNYENEDYSLNISKNYSMIILRNPWGKFCWKVNSLECLPKNQECTVGDHSDGLGMCCNVVKMYKLVDPVKRAKVEYIKEKSGTDDYIQKYFRNQELPFPALTKQFLLNYGIYDQEVSNETTVGDLVRYIKDITYPANCELSDQTQNEYHDFDGREFSVSRNLIVSLGFLSRSSRSRLLLLKKDQKLVKDLKNLDKRSARNTFKVAVVYVAKGQEDKCSIMSNTEGSLEYEQFLRNLGWEIELAGHEGFLGGLCRDSSTGTSTIYYSDVNNEVIFHVSTRLPTDSSSGFISKLRHIGNDEVHIVWSEHDRPFRRGIINTEFGDVIIVIYPMKSSLYRIQLITRPNIIVSGSLNDGDIVEFSDLAPLVMSTVLTVSSILRCQNANYEHMYSDRRKCISGIVRQNVDGMTFDEFCARIVDPEMKSSKQDCQI